MILVFGITLPKYICHFLLPLPFRQAYVNFSAQWELNVTSTENDAPSNVVLTGLTKSYAYCRNEAKMPIAYSNFNCSRMGGLRKSKFYEVAPITLRT